MVTLHTVKLCVALVRPFIEADIRSVLMKVNRRRAKIIGHILR